MLEAGVYGVGLSLVVLGAYLLHDAMEPPVLGGVAVAIGVLTLGTLTAVYLSRLVRRRPSAAPQPAEPPEADRGPDHPEVGR